MRKIISLHTTSTRHIPQRTCVACRKVKAKRELIRIVHTSDNNVEIDTDGKKAGRGAYLCRVWECWETGLKGNRLEYALHGRLTQPDREQLAKYAREFLEGAN